MQGHVQLMEFILEGDSQANYVVESMGLLITCSYQSPLNLP